MKSKPFKDLSTRGKAWASGVIGVSLAIVAAAQRDLQHRLLRRSKETSSYGGSSA
jgi:hypothetical protein